MINKIFILFFVLNFCNLTQAETLLLDTDFTSGYAVMSPQKDIFTNRGEIEAVHTIDPATQLLGLTPDWRLVQWGSDRSLANSPVQSTEKSGKRWEATVMADNKISTYKAVSVDTGGVLTLELNGMAERNGSYLQSLEHRWPHLLMAQNIYGKRLDQYKKIEFSLDAKLLFDHKNISDGYRVGIHAARFPVAFAIRNTLSGNLFWLSLVIYDDRYPQSSFLCQKCRTDKSGQESCRVPENMDESGRWECPFDGNRWSKPAEKQGTGKMIFRIPTKAYTKENIHKGEWTHYRIDLIPYIQAGIQAAQETRSLRGFTKDLRFYELGFFSMGWEITGLNHAAIAVKNLSLTGL